MPRPSRIVYSESEFRALAERLGARSASAPSVPSSGVLAAISLVTEGLVVSAADAPAAPELPTGAIVQAGVPSPYRLTQWTEAGDDWEAVNDRFEIDVHGATSMTHIDTPEHFSWSHTPPRPATPAGALLDLASTGVVGRGVLIDVAGVLGTPAQGGVVSLDDVQQVLDRTGLSLSRGDALFVSFGRKQRARSDIPLGSQPTAGLSIECVEWLADLAPSAVVTDEGLDAFPSEVSGYPVPWHLILLTVLGVPLVDRAMLAPLAETCARRGRWEFMSVLAPLPIPGASGSPLNPLAIF